MFSALAESETHDTSESGIGQSKPPPIFSGVEHIYPLDDLLKDILQNSLHYKIACRQPCQSQPKENVR